MIAVDVGNQRIKLGEFSAGASKGLPEPPRTLQLDGRRPQLGELGAWLSELTGAESWWIGSVNRPAATQLVDWLRNHRGDDRVVMLASGDLPLRVDVPRADMVGIDRLLDALAADRLRDPTRPAVAVDMGSAITVDLISADGAFQGGAILPGLAMSARALHEFTDLLPLLDARELTAPPPAVGTSTVPAMQSGLFWGALGAIRQLVERLTAGEAEEADIFLTGGASPAMAEILGPRAHHVPHLTLAGIALAAQSQTTK